MKWSWKLGEVAGIGIFVHWTFLLLIGYIVIVRLQMGDDTAGVIEGVALMIAVFGCIVLHELGHALTAKRYGVRTRDITLLPIGGVARLERIPEDPVQEFWIAVAGPAVNVAIAAILFVVLLLWQGARILTQQAIEQEVYAGDFLVNLIGINILLVLFNLLPAFPMDGGRVLRAALAHFTGDYVRATQTAASVGQIMAILFGLLGLFGGNFWLLFIALFVFLGAQEEAHSVQVRSIIRGVPVREAMMTRVHTLSVDDPLQAATAALVAGAQQDFPVVDAQGQLQGMLYRQDVLSALAEGHRDRRVGEVMRRDCGAVEDNEMLEATFQRMREGGCPTLPVVRAGKLVGMVTLENVGELMMIHSAQRRGQPRSQVQNLFGR